MLQTEHINTNLNKKILIVEDDRTTLQVLKSFIYSMGYEVADGVASGDAAIGYLKEKTADLILMDIALEGCKDGIETAEEINRSFNTPLIYITSSSDTETIERSKATNPFGYIIKPIDRKDLKSGIEMAFLRFEMEMKLKHKEDKLSSILNSISEAVIVSGADGRINYVNPIAGQYFKQDEFSILGSPLNNILKIKKSGNGGSDINGATYAFIKGYGEFPITYSINPVINADSTTDETVIVFRDDTERFKSRENARESLKKLNQSMNGIILAMARALESRDPYTAGHQRRVSDLSGAIAEKMGMSKSIIDAVKMSGIIHDMGKISIPAEILSKPGKLTDIEFDLMKTHSQTGYDILVNIDFPMPLAEIVYQHHEKLDGSGYPRGLKECDILPEAKILAVADSVEAMASDRPYRPSLGLDFALDEIAGLRGTHYDADIVNTCVKLFREDGYTMQENL